MEGPQFSDCILEFLRNNTEIFNPRHLSRGDIVAAEKIEQKVWQAVEWVVENPALIADEIERQKTQAATDQSILGRERAAYEKQLASTPKI